MDDGWIKLHRKFLDSPIFANMHLCRLWIYCLLRANWKDSKWLVPGTLREIKVPAGSFLTGRESLYAALYPDRDRDGRKIKYDSKPTSMTVWRWAEALEAMDCIKLENMFNRCTLLTICNYTTYQQECSTECATDVQPVFNRRSTGVQPVFTEEEGKESKKGRSNTHNFVPPTVEEVAAYCAERRNTVDPEAFFSHYDSNGWMIGKAKMKKWKSAIVTWEKNNFQRSQPANPTAVRCKPASLEDLENYRP